MIFFYIATTAYCCTDSQVKLRETVQPLINKARGTHCQQCLSKKQLQVKLVFEIEELARQFEAEYPADEFDKVSDKQTNVDNAIVIIVVTSVCGRYFFDGRIIRATEGL